MYEVLKAWADKYDPLTHEEEISICRNNNREDALELMMKHNSRCIITQVNKWWNTYDKDDATQIVFLALVKTFHNWDYENKSFAYWARFRVKAALHRNIPKHKDKEDLGIDEELLCDTTNSHYSDLRELLEDALDKHFTKKDAQMVRDIYFNDQSIAQAGSNYGFSSGPSKSRKHKELLSKLKTLLSNDLEDYLLTGE